MAGTFWALDRDLARGRHFPAVDWRRSYTLYRLDGWFTSRVATGWRRQREWALELLQRETSLLEIVQILGVNTLPAQQQVVLRTGRLLREDFLQQSSFDETAAYCPLAKQLRPARGAARGPDSYQRPGARRRSRGWPPCGLLRPVAST
jgi:V/A-type H+/Na+-transporting ATPase subunit A